MKRYSVETVTEAAVRYFYIQDCETMEMELLPSRYLVHKVKSNRSPNTVKRAAFALCYYLEYLSEKQMEFSQVLWRSEAMVRMKVSSLKSWRSTGGRSRQSGWIKASRAAGWDGGTARRQS